MAAAVVVWEVFFFCSAGPWRWLSQAFKLDSIVPARVFSQQLAARIDQDLGWRSRPSGPLEGANSMKKRVKISVMNLESPKLASHIMPDPSHCRFLFPSRVALTDDSLGAPCTSAMLRGVA